MATLSQKLAAQREEQRMKDARKTVEQAERQADIKTPEYQAETKPIAQPTAEAGEVVFRSYKPELGAQFKNKILKFHSHFYKTSNQAEIDYLRTSAAHFGLIEEKE